MLLPTNANNLKRNVFLRTITVAGVILADSLSSIAKVIGNSKKNGYKTDAWLTARIAALWLVNRGPIL
jgi:hypothetical protein